MNEPFRMPDHVRRSLENLAKLASVQLPQGYSSRIVAQIGEQIATQWKPNAEALAAVDRAIANLTTVAIPDFKVELPDFSHLAKIEIPELALSNATVAARLREAIDGMALPDTEPVAMARLTASQLVQAQEPTADRGEFEEADALIGRYWEAIRANRSDNRVIAGR